MHFSLRTLTGIAVFVAIAFLYTINSISARDPTSFFFDPRKGYAPRYSAVRQRQAEAYISSYNPATVVKVGDEKHRKLCVGIPSLNRPEARYLRDTVGSLLDGLTPEERQEIYLMVFIPHSNPDWHPAYHEKWLSDLTDKILTYNFGIDRMQTIRQMELRNKFDEKGLFDYSYLLDKCTEQLTSYVVIIEDDTVAMDGWYHRTIAAIHEAEQQAALQRAKPEFLYLRLFYTEEFLGWNAENWKTYLRNSILIAIIPTIFILVVRFTTPTTKLSLTLLTIRTFIFIHAVLAIGILLFFALGRNTMFSMPTGVHEMSQFGCCSQAFVFPSNKALELVDYFKERRLGYVDVLTEDFANERGELRYAVTPSLVQHVGRNGDNDRHGTKSALSLPQKIWSFSFERFNEVVLKKEHEDVAAARAEQVSAES